MSNCVEIYNEVVLDPELLDVEKLLADVDLFKDLKYRHDMSNTDMGFYWFLTPETVYRDGDLVVLALGKGRSGHTWRDLRGTATILATYVKTENVCLPLDMADEYDGFATEFRHELNLSDIR